jgi:polysaccharide biosynthesis transport protein
MGNLDHPMPRRLPGPVAAPMGPGAETVDVQHLARTLWRRKLLILVIMFGLWVPAALVIRNMIPIYSATAIVVIDPRPNQVIDISSVVDRAGVYADTVNTEVESIRSRDLAKSVIETLHLDQEPEINPTLKTEPGLVARWIGDVVASPMLPKEVRTLIQAVRWDEKPAPQDDAVLMTEMIDAFLKRLVVGASPQSRAIRIGFESAKPQLTARVANAVAQAYQASQVATKREATARAGELLKTQLGGLRDERADASQQTETFRSEAGLTRGRDGMLIGEELSALNAQLTDAKAALSSAQSRLQQVSTLGRGGTDSLATSEVISSPLIGSLRQQQSVLKSRIADLRQRYGKRHPAVASASAELQDVNNTIATEIDRVTRSLRNDASREEARVREMSHRMDKLRAEARDAMQAEVKLREYQLSSEATDNNYRRAVARLKEMEILQAISTPDAHIVSSATVPAFPVEPNKPLLGGLAGIVSAIIAVSVAFLMETTKRGLLSTHQVEAALRLPALGVIPLIRPLRRGYGHAVIENRKSGKELMEFVARLAARLLLSGPVADPREADRHGKVLMVTSSQPKEGKTLLAVALGTYLADGGRKVVVVDCDTRRPKVHLVVGSPNSRGLTDFLTGRATLADVLCIEPDRALAVIAAGKRVERPQKLLGSQAMASLLYDLCTQFDVVILDTPPVIAVSDSLVLAALADRILYVVQWGRTAEAHARAGIRQLRDASGSIAGVVLSMVNLRRHDTYEYGSRPTGYSYYLPVDR